MLQEGAIVARCSCEGADGECKVLAAGKGPGDSPLPVAFPHPARAPPGDNGAFMGTPSWRWAAFRVFWGGKNAAGV